MIKARWYQNESQKQQRPADSDSDVVSSEPGAEPHPVSEDPGKAEPEKKPEPGRLYDTDRGLGRWAGSYDPERVL